MTNLSPDLGKTFGVTKNSAVPEGSGGGGLSNLQKAELVTSLLFAAGVTASCAGNRPVEATAPVVPAGTDTSPLPTGTASPPAEQKSPVPAETAIPVEATPTPAPSNLPSMFDGINYGSYGTKDNAPVLAGAVGGDKIEASLNAAGQSGFKVPEANNHEAAVNTLYYPEFPDKPAGFAVDDKYVTGLFSAQQEKDGVVRGILPNGQIVEKRGMLWVAKGNDGQEKVMNPVVISRENQKFGYPVLLEKGNDLYMALVDQDGNMIVAPREAFQTPGEEAKANGFTGDAASVTDVTLDGSGIMTVKGKDGQVLAELNFSGRGMTFSERVSKANIKDILNTDTGAFIPQLAEAMQKAGVNVTAEQMVAGANETGAVTTKADGSPLIDKNGNPFAVAYYNSDPDPSQKGEAMEGKMAIGVFMRSGEKWEWRPFTLKTFTDLTGIKTGALISGGRSTGNEAYRRTLLQNYSMAIIDGPFWEDRSGDINNPNFSKFNTAAEFAKNQGMSAEFQHLVRDEWRWYPKSLEGQKLTPAEAEKILRNIVRKTVDQYKGSINVWSVVNEAINGDAKGGFTSNPFYDAMGIDYVRVAFEEARAAAPDATLLYNDFDLESNATKRQQVHEFLQPLIDRGLVNGVGFQLHIDATRPPNKADVVKAMQEVAGWGVSVHVTELDVDMTNFRGTPEEKLRAQAKIYSEMLGALLESGHAETFSTFGFTDLTSLYGTDNSPEALAASPLPFDSNMNPKAAYVAMLETATQFLMGE